MIGEYQPITNWKTVQSGAFLWCIAMKDGRQHMLKRFTNPRWSKEEQTTDGILERNRCILFEQRKQRLYRALSLVPDTTIVPVTDFFQHDVFYYSALPVLKKGSRLLVNAEELSREEKRQKAAELALAMIRMHEQGIIHGDFRQEYVYLSPEGIKLTDFESAFLVDDPPDAGDWFADPRRMPPEAEDYRNRLEVKISTAYDRFSFGLLLHCLWSGEEPETEKGMPVWQSIRQIKPIKLSERLFPEEKRLIASLLALHPENRPTDAELLRALERMC